MSKARVHARNLAANWIAHGANLVVAAFLSPFIVHTLTRPVYGIWSLMMVVTGYMGLFDLGVRASTGRYIILYIGRDEHDRVDETIRTGMGLFTVVGILIVAAGFVIGWVFPSVFRNVDPGYHGLLRVLMPVIAGNVLISAYAAVFSSVLTAHDRFDLTRGVDLTVVACRAGATVLVLRAGYGLAGMTAVLSGCNILALVGNWYLARKVYPRLRVWPLAVIRSRLRELFGYGAWAFVTSISYRIVGMTDLVVVGILIGPSAAAVYSIGAMLVYYSTTFLNHISSTFFPPVQRSVARGEMGPARWLFYRQVRLALVFGMPVFLGFIVFGERFIHLWMFDPEFSESAVAQAALVMAILSASKLLGLMSVGSTGLLAALGHIRFNGVISLVQAVINLVLSVLFVVVLGWGVAGVAAGTLAANILVSAFSVPWYACLKGGMSFRYFVLRVGGRGLFCAAVVWALYGLVRSLLPGDSWGMFWVQVVLAAAGYVPIGFWLLVPKADRLRVLRKLRPGSVTASEI